MKAPDKRLQTLAASGICSCQNASKYASELKEIADNQLNINTSQTNSKIFKALADSTRLRILGLLSLREMCVCEVMVALNLTQPTASHHLRILENVGLVKDRKEGKWVFYRIINPQFFKDVCRLVSF
jgi:ArsR family transcriptional regulator, arsenate/arsenite/antimonite-responsive transcriptional repressor